MAVGYRFCMRKDSDDRDRGQSMRSVHMVVLAVLVAIFVALAIFFVIGLIQGDDTANPPTGIGAPSPGAVLT